MFAIKSRKIMTQLVVTLRDRSFLPSVRRIVKSLQGVEHVSTPRKDILIRTRKSVSAKQQGKTSEHITADEISDPIEALEDIGRIIRNTGKTSEQLIDEYLEEKYGL